jgi:protein-L-isoaspartate(D-aspartate) O-methyltransferase
MGINTQFVYTDPDRYKSERNHMVERHLRARDVRDPAVLNAMRKLPRHLFVAPSQEGEAYEDSPLSIPCGQTISQPYMVAKSAELLELTGHEKVLEIGAGCGYQAALLGMLAAEVVALEWFDELARLARANVERLGMKNIRIEQGDGKAGCAQFAPYDRILVSCAVREVPSTWEPQLRPGGILLFPLGPRHDEQYLWRWRKSETGWKSKERIFSVRFVPLL